MTNGWNLTVTHAAVQTLDLSACDRDLDGRLALELKSAGTGVIALCDLAHDAAVTTFGTAPDADGKVPYHTMAGTALRRYVVKQGVQSLSIFNLSIGGSAEVRVNTVSGVVGDDVEIR